MRKIKTVRQKPLVSNYTLNELFFKSCVDAVNDNSSSITTSTARYMHRRVADNLANQFHGYTVREQGKNVPITAKKSFIYAKKSHIINACQSVFGDNALDYDELYENVRATYEQMSGVNNSSRLRFEQPVIPLSPYDSRYENLSIFRQQGGNTLYAYEADVINSESDEDVNVYRLYDSGKLGNVGKLVNDADYSGLSILSPFMSKSDFDSVESWVSDTVKANPDLRMSDDALYRAEAVLRHLRDIGVDYTIKPDSFPGQIKACLDDTNVSIRIMDVRPNERYVGSVYNDGIVSYYMTNGKNEKGRPLPYNDATVDDTINLIDYTLGKEISRDDGKPVGSVGAYSSQSNSLFYNSSYYSANAYSAVVKSKDDYKVLIHSVNNRTTSSGVSINTPEFARTFLEKAIDSARSNFVQTLDIDTLKSDAEKYGSDDSYVPDFSGNEQIAIIQQGYWNLLTHKSSYLLKPQYINADVPKTEEEFYERIYVGTPEEQIEQHMADCLDTLVGSYESDENGKRFDPITVATFMTSDSTFFRNKSNIITALRELDIDAEELKGNESYNKELKDSLLKFNSDTAKPMSDVFQADLDAGKPLNVHQQFVKNMYDVIYSTLTQTGVEIKPEDILFDDNGVVHYSGNRISKEKLKYNKSEKQFESVSTPVTGEIGQLFIPDGMGIVTTNFYGNDNYMFSPGYEAYIVPQKPGENLSMMERMRLKGYEQIMADRIRYCIRTDLISSSSNIGSTTNLNTVYRHTYSTRYPLDYFEQAAHQGMPEDILHDIIKTNSQRIRLSNYYKEGSTINEHYRDRMGKVDALNDNFDSAYIRTGRTNISVIGEDRHGYVDPDATSQATNQGVVMYLVDGAKVNIDGSITPSDDPNDRTALMKNRVFDNKDNVPPDRLVMTVSNILKAKGVCSDVKTAQMAFGGWTYDDGYVVSKAFADAHPITDGHGNFRSLKIGDKISDMYGNKGVISLVVDKDMDMDEAKAQKLDKAVAWFKANPDLEVIGAPYAGTSRFNAGSAISLMQKPHDLNSPDGTVHKGCMGETTYMITAADVDNKTHNYAEENSLSDTNDFGDGEADGSVSVVSGSVGRRASAQASYSFAAKDAKKLLRNFYKFNGSSLKTLREYFVTMGLDIDELGNMHTGYQPHPDEKRKVFKMQPFEYRRTKATEKRAGSVFIDMSKMKSDFGYQIDKVGGVLELPFKLKMATGEDTPKMNDNKTDVVYKATEWERKGYYRKDGTFVKPTIVHRNPDAETSRKGSGHETYGLPIMSPSVRCGQELIDGTTHTHNYTIQYLKIYEASILYRDAQDKFDTESKKQNPDNEALAKLQETMDKTQSDAQLAYNRMADDIKTRVFEGKHNIFRDKIMSNRLPNSATAVWTADPRLDIDQVAMNEAMADSLGVTKDDYVLIWRDPIHRDSGIKYMRVAINNDLTGVAINPVSDAPFQGDFDGDTVGILSINDQQARGEAYDKFGMHANLLDEGVSEPMLSINNGMDVATAEFEDPSLKNRKDAMVDKIVSITNDSSLSFSKRQRALEKCCDELNEIVHDTFDECYGGAMLCFSNPKELFESLEKGCVLSGAKGSHKKLQDYLKYFGATCEMTDASNRFDDEDIARMHFDDNGQCFDLDTFNYTGKSLATQADKEAVMTATAIKSGATGVAGSYLHRVMILRNICPKACTEVTYPVTQSVLQSKHDPVQAAHLYEMIMGPARDLWRGYKLTDASDGYRVVKENGQPVQATKDEFINQFVDLYTSKDGLNVDINRKYVEQIANVLVDDTGHMRSIESDFKEQVSAPLDLLAYGGTFDTAVNMAKNNVNLFDGKYNQCFAPSEIRNNIYYQRQGEDLKPIMKANVKESATPKVKKGSASLIGTKTTDGVSVSGPLADKVVKDMSQRFTSKNAGSSLNSFTNSNDSGHSDMGDE